ncbi:MAG TPA: hypothetical protein VIJ31_01265 [Acidothermaceae bacterium]
MPSEQMGYDFNVDANGFLTKRVVLGGQDVIIHYADMPESDITTVKGLRCTTALRTVIDIASGIDAPELDVIVRDFLKRRLFSRKEAIARIAEPDMLNHPGAQLLRQALVRSGGS